MSQFPRMLFKSGGIHEIHGGFYDYEIVQGDEQFAQFMADGWSISPAEAKRLSEVPVTDVVADPVPSDDVAPTRAELERKATELGIAFDGRTSDAKLSGKIAERMKG